jgi:S1-C subfamily serine protease
MALLVKAVGQYGPHATARKAGFEKGDVLIAFDGRTDLGSEADVMRHAVQARRPGDQVRIKLMRNGQPRELTLSMQE